VRAFNEAAHASKHYSPLSFSAFEFALKGVTTLEEVLRVSALVEDESIDEV
jgi:MSHA biogenesis protein MshE